MPRVLYVDPSIAGVSGNMLLGALVDLGASPKGLEALARIATSKFGCEVEVSRERVRRYGFGALWVDWNIQEVAEDIPGMLFLKRVKELAQAHALSERAADFAGAAGTALVEAEAAVHDQGVEEVVFHELGSYDTVLDMVGTTLLLDELRLLEPGVEVYAAPINVGRGNLEVRHGHLSVPPFVTAELLVRSHIPHRFSHVEGELATPTGVALLAALVDHWSQDLVLSPTAMGHGAGRRELQGVPNVLRLVMGELGPPQGFVSVIETTVDDVTGEVIGYTLEKLMASGALDVQVIPTTGKKSRPGYILQVISKPEDEGNLARILLRETGSLGVRIDPLRKRSVVEREVVVVDLSSRGINERVGVKVSRDGEGRPVRWKAEYEDARRVAEGTGLPLRDVMREAEAAAAEQFRAKEAPPGRGGRKSRSQGRPKPGDVGV
jgi:hypothetical protein